jgi:ABC-type molybdate transport system substrate-binding protein
MRDAVMGLLLIIVGCGQAAPISIPCDGGRGADHSSGGELAVAAPAELNSAISEVAAAFEQKTGNHVRLTFGDSASLYSQIRNGATFDAFFSADMKDFRRLAASGVAVGASSSRF